MFTLFHVIFVDTPDAESQVFMLAGFFIFMPLIFLLVDFIRKRVGWKLFVFGGLGWLVAAVVISGYVSRNALAGRNSTGENRCKLTLRILGSSQLAFLDENQKYGSWEELVDSKQIHESYSRENITSLYKLDVFEANPAVLDDSGKEVKPISFTIVAIPSDIRATYLNFGIIRYVKGEYKPLTIAPGRSFPNYLRTFAIGEDQTPRVWVGDDSLYDPEKISLHDITMLEPLR